MNELEKVLQKVEPSKIGYFTFQETTQEGKSRAMDKFNLTERLTISELFTHFVLIY